MLSEGTVLKNGYVIDELLGQGGAGAVCWARATRPGGMRVALKRVKIDLPDPGLRAKHRVLLQRHARLLTLLKHPGVVPLVDFFEEADVYYFAMEWVDGKSLAQVRKQGPLELALVFDWAEELCQTLEWLHQQDPPVLARNLQPSTVLIDGKGHLQLSDLGIGGLQDGDSETATALQDSVGYAPAEQFGSQAGSDVRSDVYALGATLYTLVTGLVPPCSLDLANRKAQLLPPQQHNPQVPLLLSDIILNMMALRRANRYPTVKDARQALVQVRASCLEGRPEDWSATVQPRNMRVVAAMGLLQVTVLAAVGWLVMFAFGPRPQPVPSPPPHPSATATATPTPTPTPTSMLVAEESLRSYAELLKNPSELGFTGSDAVYRGIYSAVSNSYVDETSPAQLRQGLLAELGNLVTQAHGDTAGLKEMAGIAPEEAYSKAQQLWGTQIDSNVLGYATMNGLIEGLGDRYSVLLTPTEWGKLEQQRDLGDVGASLERANSSLNPLTILGCSENSPALKAGLRAGDGLIRIDEKSTRGMPPEIAQMMLKGPVDSQVVVTVVHDGATKDYSLTRTLIAAPPLATRMLTNQIGYVRLVPLSGGDLAKAVADLKQQGAKGLIVDLRNTTDDDVEAAVFGVSQFSPAKTLVGYATERGGTRQDYTTQASGEVDLPLVCLVNRYTVGSAEIVAAALRDHQRAKLVGERTFGKGSRQQLYDFESPEGKGPRLKLTVARYHSPQGEPIGQGIAPELVVEMDPRLVGTENTDLQLSKALETFTPASATPGAATPEQSVPP